MLVNTEDMISISEATSRGLSALVREAEEGRERILVRNNRPVAALVSMERLEELRQLEDDMRDIWLASARMLTAGPERISLDEILEEFGYTREQLREMPD